MAITDNDPRLPDNCKFLQHPSRVPRKSWHPKENTFKTQGKPVKASSNTPFLLQHFHPTFYLIVFMQHLHPCFWVKSFTLYGYLILFRILISTEAKAIPKRIAAHPMLWRKSEHHQVRYSFRLARKEGASEKSL